MDLVTIFITGLFAGGLTCLAVQGGLLASSIAQQEEEKNIKEADEYAQAIPIVSFLATRLVAYTIVGIMLGALGSVAQLSLSTRVLLQFAVVIFMAGTAFNLLHIHPIFRYFVIQPPKFLTRLVRKQSKSKSIFGPAVLGAFTVFIPCGATQAMMAYAVSTGSWIGGGATMFTFILGTSPLFFALGYAAQKLGTRAHLHLNKVAALAIIAIAIYNLYGAVALSGNDVAFGNIFLDKSTKQIVSTQAVKEATIYFTQFGYETSPTTITVKGGSKIKLNLINQNGAGCVQAFTIPKFGIQKTVPVGGSDQISVTVPTDVSSISFMCSMGMYRGVINVI